MTFVLSPQQGPVGQMVELQQIAGGPLRASVVDVSSGGGGSTPLSSVFWVDPFSVAPGTPDGSIEHPFLTITDGVAACPSLGTLLLCPGDYGGEEFVITGAKQISIVGVAAPSSRTLNTITVKNIGTIGADPTSVLQFENIETASISVDNSVLQLTNVYVNGDVICSGEPDWQGVHVTGDVSCARLVATGCQIDGTVTPQSSADPISFDRCILNIVDSTANVSIANQSIVAGALTTKGLVLANSTVIGDITQAGAGTFIHATSSICGNVTCRELRASDTTFGAITLTSTIASRLTTSSFASLTKTGAPGAVTFDAYTAGSASAEPVNVVSQLIAPRGVLIVTVPTLLAGDLGTVATTLVGTGLEGLKVGDQVVSNTPSTGVVGGGALLGSWIDADNSVTLQFLGPTTGGDDQFIVTRI